MTKYCLISGPLFAFTFTLSWSELIAKHRFNRQVMCLRQLRPNDLMEPCTDDRGFQVVPGEQLES